MSATLLPGRIICRIIGLYFQSYRMGGLITRYAAILLSRQSLRPTRQTAWVAQSVKAVSWLQKQRIGLSGSIGMQTWELLTTLAVEHNLPLRLFVPASTEALFEQRCRDAVRQFSLSNELTRFVRVSGDSKDETKRTMTLRDQLVCDQADLLLPVSVRNTGNMSRLIADAKLAQRELVFDFQITHHAPATPLKCDYGELSLGECRTLAGTWLTHWTRGLSGKWPDERPIDLYRAILASDRWPRSAMDTLERVVASRRILATTRHMPQDTRTVCFSGLSPEDVVPLMRWRARYSEMSFEPYGIGIDSVSARQAGVRPVRYLAKGELPEAETTERWLVQGIGEITDWRAEQEYRCRGDLDFSNLPQERVVLFCQTKKEARRLRDRFPYRVIPLFEDA